jgi:tol-pal system protein YbgF
MTRACVWLAIVTLVTTGCATRGSVRRLGADLEQMRIELAEVRQAHEATSRELAQALRELQILDARTADVQAGIRETTAEMANLRARVDVAEQELREARALAAAPPPAMPVPPAAPPPPAVSGPPAAPSAPAPRSASPPPLAAPPPPADSRPAVPRPSAETSARAPSPEQIYAAALQTFRAREHGQAVLDFLDFIAKYPQHYLVGNAQYWIGEAYYVQRDYRQALVEFQKVHQLQPDSPKVPDALLKIGLCYTNLHDATRAQRAWLRVVKDHPKSPAALKARSLLRAHAAGGRS